MVAHTTLLEISCRGSYSNNIWSDKTKIQFLRWPQLKISSFEIRLSVDYHDIFDYHPLREYNIQYMTVKKGAYINFSPICFFKTTKTYSGIS